MLPTIVQVVILRTLNAVAVGIPPAGKSVSSVKVVDVPLTKVIVP